LAFEDAARQRGDGENYSSSVRPQLWTARTAALRYDLRASHQVVGPHAGFCTVGFLRAVLATDDDQHAVLNDAIAGSKREPPAFK
jgi:hypothetical protein